MWNSLTEAVRMMVLSQALNQAKKKKDHPSELKALTFLEMNYFLFIKKEKKTKRLGM